MIRDRGYDVSELNSLIGNSALETSGNIYTRALEMQISLAEAARFSFTLNSTNSSSSSSSTSSTSSTRPSKAKLWLLDRNFDLLKQKERMTSTDQIKSIYDFIEAEPDCSHIILATTKCSPQAKKELNANAELFIFDEMLIDLPRHIQVSKHTEVSLESVKAFFGQSFNQNDLPLLPSTDPVAKWYAWPIGTIIFVDNPIMPKFRLVS